MTGAIFKLKVKGDQDKLLTGTPLLNFFKKEYKQYNNFAIEQTKIYFYEDVDFGKKITCILPRKADYLSKLYFTFTLPALSFIDGTFASWTNSIGHAIINTIELEIGDRLIDRHYGLFLEIWEELTSKERNENLMIGKISNMESLKVNALTESTYTVPLRFWFCENVHSAFPLMALHYHTVKISIKLKTFNECVTYDGTIAPNTVKILDSYILTDYIFVDDAHRAMLKNKKYDILITQLQHKGTQGDDINTSGNVFKTNVEFNHPVKELLWVFIEEDSLSNNDWFNFSKRNTIPFTKVFSLMKDCTIHIDGKQYEEKKDEIIYRYVNSHKFHTNTTDRHIYIQSFSEFPEQYPPSGSINFSTIDDFVISGNMRSPTPANQLFVFGLNYNWITLQNGLSELKYIA